MADSPKPKAAARRKPRQADPMVSPAVQAKIGEQLRGLYDDIKSEPIPDRLLALLQQLEGAPAASPGPGSRDGSDEGGRQ